VSAHLPLSNPGSAERLHYFQCNTPAIIFALHFLFYQTFIDDYDDGTILILVPKHKQLPIFN
jgi:hypothetical protein